MFTTGVVKMKIQIKKKGNHTAILISFDIQSENFKSPSEKCKFFEELYGRKQVIKRHKKIYRYHREGVLGEIPHLNVDKSVFIIMQEHIKRMEQFFNEWENKVMVKSFPVLITDKEKQKLVKEVSDNE